MAYPVAVLLEDATAVVAAAEASAAFATTAVAYAYFGFDALTSVAPAAVLDADFEAYLNLIEEG